MKAITGNLRSGWFKDRRIQPETRVPQMPAIMIRCPISGKDVSTGLSTDAVVMASLPNDSSIPFRCPACMKIHRWGPKSACG